MVKSKRKYIPIFETVYLGGALMTVIMGIIIGDGTPIKRAQLDSIKFSDIAVVQEEDDVEISEVNTLKASSIETEEPLVVVYSDFTELDKSMYTSTAVNLRTSPNEDSDLITKVNMGEEVYVMGYEDDENWYKVQYNGAEGYMCSEYLTDTLNLIKVSSTAYWNEYDRKSASGRDLVASHSLAGKVEWLGKTADIYSCKSDGSVGSYLGRYRFDDTGYGSDTGVGSSSILEGRTIGTIENGTCIDVYFDTYEECANYGRRNLYIKFVS
jgi:uncharacterized protein YraI